MIDLAIDRQLDPAPTSRALDAKALLARAERAEAEARGLRLELGALRIERDGLERSRDWWMHRAKGGGR